MEKIAAIVLFCYSAGSSADAIDWLDQYLRQGGGVIALYPALISNPKSSTYSRMLGIEAIKPRGVNQLSVTPSTFTLPGVEPLPLFTINDMQVELSLTPGAIILYEVKNTGKTQPAVWRHTYETGRVWAMAVGKTYSSFQKPGIEKLLNQALDWCSQAKSSQPGQI